MFDKSSYAWEHRTNTVRHAREIRFGHDKSSTILIPDKPKGGGSWVVVSRVIRPLIGLITIVTVLLR